MTTQNPAHNFAATDDTPPESAQNNAEIGHKMSRPTILKDREDALRANLLKRKQQQKTRKQQNDEQ
jgi:hypothetical protein